MCPTACITDFAPGRRRRTNSAAWGGRSRASPNSTATKNPLAATSTNARTTPSAVVTGSPYPIRSRWRRGRRRTGHAVEADGAEQNPVRSGAGGVERDREGVVGDVAEADRQGE